jgi:hypothetical protein
VNNNKAGNDFFLFLWSSLFFEKKKKSTAYRISQTCPSFLPVCPKKKQKGDQKEQKG